MLLPCVRSYLLRLVNEGMERGPHTFEEEVMPIEELAVLLEQVHGDRQHAPKDVGESVPQLQQYTAWVRSADRMWVMQAASSSMVLLGAAD